MWNRTNAIQGKLLRKMEERILVYRDNKDVKAYKADYERARSHSQKIIDFLTDLRKPAITIICLGIAYIALFARQHMTWIYPLIIGMIIFIIAPYVPDWLS